MNSEQEDVDGLPTAADVDEDIRKGGLKLFNINYSMLEVGDELVRRKDAEKSKQMYATQLILEAEQQGIISAGQAQKMNDLRDDLESSNQDPSKGLDEVEKQ